jgi:hypothetical protein
MFDFFSSGEWIQVTAQYSNAVLVAVLPYLTEFCGKLGLPIASPLSTAQVLRVGLDPHRGRVGATLWLTNGYAFWFDRGQVSAFESPHCYFAQQEPEVVPRFYGQVKMSADEAIALARETVRKLGYPLEDVLADTDPYIPPLERVGTNTIPHYRIQWLDPRGGSPATEIEVDAERKVVESIRFNGLVTLRRPEPRVDVQPGKLPEGHPWRVLNEMGKVNPEYARRLVPYVFSAIEDWGRRLKWDLPLPVTTNHVKRFYVSDQAGWPHCEVTFTNGWEFKFRNSGLTYAGSPRRFFDSDKLPFRIKNYVGQWKLTEQQAIELARNAVAKLGYPEDFVHTEAKPRVFRPCEIKGMPAIPRLQIEWNYPNIERRQQWIQVEVDCDKGAVEAIYFDDGSLWGKPPPIAVPISAKAASAGSAK